MLKIIAGAIGSDIHTAGILNFLELAKSEKYEIFYAGSVLSVKKLIDFISETNPDLVAISYRLSGESLRSLLRELKDEIKKRKIKKRFVFGGTVETAAVAREFDFFDEIFDGNESYEEVIMYLRGSKRKGERKEIPQDFMERVEFKKPFPLIRHHIGLSTLKETKSAVEELSQSGLLDIISLAPDQNCQQWFFENELMSPSEDGAGGAPFRNADDFKKIYEASRTGNMPLLRCYSGTKHIVKFSRLLKETINNAWAAIPLSWYSKLDGRSDRPLLAAIKENEEGIAWNASAGIPVEINESHQWGLRYCHAAVEVATAFIAAMSAKRLGVKTYVAQYMMNTPSGISPKMDIAKALAKIDLVESLQDGHFKALRMVRPGLLAFPADPYRAMGQLVSSLFLAEFIKPDIVHVAAYCEATKRASAKEIIESVKMVKQGILEAKKGLPDFETDDTVKKQRDFLKKEASIIIHAIEQLKTGDITSPESIYRAIETGILDAPGLRKMPVARGIVNTKAVDGAYYAVDDNGKILTEKNRLKRLFAI